MFEYKKLKGRIVERFGTIREFSRHVSASEQSISMKLHCKTGISQDDIIEWSGVLEIPRNNWAEYFFA